MDPALSHPRLVVILVSVVIIYPLVWTVGASLNAGNSLLSTSIIPENVSFQHYADLFNGNVNYLTSVLELDENQLPDHGADPD